MFKLAACLLACVAAVVAVPALRVEVPAAPPSGFNITSLGVIGTGCPPGSTYYALNGRLFSVSAGTAPC